MSITVALRFHRPHRNSADSHRRGFTLVELLTVIAIVAILAGILISVVSHVRDSARKTEGISNLRQLYVGLSLYSRDNKNKLPPAIVTGPLYWTSSVAPYLGQGMLGVGQNNVFRNTQSGTNATTDEDIRAMGLASPLSCPLAVSKYDDPKLVAPTYAINAYLYNPPGYYADWSIVWTREPVITTASRPASTVIFTNARVTNQGAWYSTAGVVREIEFSNTEQLTASGMFVGWLDGHVSIENKELLFDQTHRPGGVGDIWSLTQ
ncbi:MAG: type II secretion system protein [Opitutaceae bacterium]|jgi:prepilin-type N-terminal cleavage/methylation domain-containing protein